MLAPPPKSLPSSGRYSMYQNLINSLKKILDSKATQAEKLLKISTLVDFADGLEGKGWRAPQPTPPIQPAQPLQATKPTAGPGAIVGVEDIK